MTSPVSDLEIIKKNLEAALNINFEENDKKKTMEKERNSKNRYEHGKGE